MKTVDEFPGGMGGGRRREPGSEATSPPPGRKQVMHFFPYELTRCHNLRRSRVSTRAIYGNHKLRPPFPRLTAPVNAEPLAHITPATCSVCDGPLEGDHVVRRWITLAVGTDWLPLLVNACSEACLTRLPKPPAGYVPVPHGGGREVVQPSADEW